MSGSYVIAMDVHSYSTEVLVTTPGGRLRETASVATSVPALRAIVERTPRSRVVVMEEGPLAEWLVRNLSAVSDDVVVAETRRNAYVARDGDKDDAIDTVKLDRLFRGGFIRPVHHRTDATRTAFKDLVLLHHGRVRERVKRANRAIFAFRGEGVVVTEKSFADATQRPALLGALPGGAIRRLRWATLLADYDAAAEQEATVRQQLIRRSRRIDPVRRFTALPGVGWVRAATFYALIDTPFRFANRAKLCKYMGIGLERRHSGAGLTHVKTTPACNRVLKNVILGAAGCAVARCEPNVFQSQYRRLIQEGKTHRTARRTVARSMAATMWGMWKSQSTYDADRVGRRTDDRMNRSAHSRHC